MACRYTYQGKTYEAYEFDDVLRAMPPAIAAQFMPSVKEIPTAPFVTKTDAWLNLALKRVITMAAQEGYDRVAFINGEQSADRYDLSKSIDSIIAGKEDDGTYSLVASKGGRELIKRDNVPAAELENLVGKEMAKKIVDGGGKDIGRGEREFTGLDLKVGGEGMKAFYDQIVPSAVKKLLPKVGGGQIHDVSIASVKNVYTVSHLANDTFAVRMYPPNAEGEGVIVAGGIKTRERAKEVLAEMEAEDKGPGQPGFDITPAMREKAAQGLPMFARNANGEEGQLPAIINPSNVANVQKAITELLGGKQLTNSLGRIVATTAAEIKSTWEPLIGKNVQIGSEGEAGVAQAFFEPGTKTVFMIADHINVGTETAVLAHELMHKHGLAVLGKAGWDRLHGMIGTWKDAAEDSDERFVYDYATRKVQAVGEELSTQELFPYAVEAAIRMGVKPSLQAKRGTVANWLESVRQSLKTVWGKITGKPDTFKAQDLVDLAFGIAQMENPESAGAIEGALARGENIQVPFEPVKTSVGTAYKAGDIALAAPRLNPRQPGNGDSRIDYKIRDRTAFAQAKAEGQSDQQALEASHVGYVTMDVDPSGQFKALRYIMVFESQRGRGVANKVVGSIMATLPANASLHVYDILPAAVDFWAKMGAKFPRSNEFMEAHLTPQQYRSTYAQQQGTGRGAPDQRAGGEPQGDTRGTGRGSAPDEGVAGRGPDEGETISYSRGSNKNDYTDLEREALARAGIRGKRTVRDSIRSGFDRATQLLRDRSELWSAFRQGNLDQFHGIDRAVKSDLGGLPTDQDPYVAARLANGGTSGVMRALLLHGQAKWAANGQHLEKIPDTKGLLDILAPLDDDLNDWFGWMVGNRAAILKSEGRENNLSDEQIKALQGLAKDKKEEFRKAATEYAAFKKSVLDVAEQAGLIDPVGRKAWDHADYIPFYRQIDAKASFSATGRKGLAGQSSGIRVLKGGESALNDPMENLLMNFSRLIDASLKNNAIRKTVEVLKVTGRLQKVGYEMAGAVVPKEQVRKILIEAGTPEAALDAMPNSAFDGMAKLWAIQAPSDPDVVRVMVSGKPQFYRVQDPLLLKALTSFVPFDFPGLFMMRGAKRVLTRMVTSTPDFMLRNFIRDSVAAQGITRHGFNPAKSLQGILKSYTESGAFEPMLFAGASFQAGNVNAADPTGTAQAMRRALRAKGLSAASADSFLGSVMDTGLRGVEHYFEVSEAIENSNREAVYEATQKETGNATAAAYEAKDLMDFSLRGSGAIYQLAADVLPFFNARVQGLYRLGRADPKRLAAMGMLMMTVTLLLAMVNDGEDWYEELEDWDKDTYWHFMIGGKHFRLPKPFELGVVFATFPERIGRAVKGLDSRGKTADRVWANLRDQLAIDPVPQLIKPQLEVWANKDRFRDRPIETLADEGKLPSSRFNANTSDTARVASQAMAPVSDMLGMSPKAIEHMVNGYFGTVGGYALGLSDMVTRKLENQAPRPEIRLDDIPVVKSFYREQPARGTLYESEFYKMRDEVTKIAKTIKAYRKAEDDAHADGLEKREEKKLDVKKDLDRTAKQLTQMRKDRDEIMRDRTMTPKEKRVAIDELQIEQNQITRELMRDPVIKAVR